MPVRPVVFWLIAGSLRVLAFQPTFHSETRLVQINVVVRDKNGPVSNLTKDDFRLTDGGKPRKISVFSVVPSTVLSTSAPALAENTFSNRMHGKEPAPPSVTIILLDPLNNLTGPGSQPYEEHATWIEDQALANARQHLMKFVATLQPKDRVAIYSLGRSLTVLCDFTSDRERLHAVLDNYHAVSLTRREDVEPLAVHTPMSPPGFDAAIDADRRALAALANRDRASTTLAALVSIAAHVADIPGRKNLVWLTANLPFSAAAAGRALSRADVAIYPVDARGLLTQAAPMDQNDQLARELFGRNGVATGQSSQPTGITAMQDIAAQTGGRAFLNSNDVEGGIRRAIEDAAVTYTLGFYADSPDGKFHELKVRIPGESYEVRYPRGYFATVEAASDRRNQLLEAVLTPLESTAIGVVARIERLKDGGVDSLRITGTIDLHSLALEKLTEGWSGAINVYVVQQDAAGGVLDRTRQRYDLKLTDRLYEDYLKSGVSIQSTIRPKQDVATLRVLVAEAYGSRIGSVIIPYTSIH